VTEADSPRRRGQAGFTLVELLIASALGMLVLTALTSVVLTTYQANQVATSRVLASGEIRNFQQTAYDDFASSSLPSAPAGCGTSSQPCSQNPIDLNGCALVSGSPQKRSVSYAWSSGTGVVDRKVGTRTVNPAASNVTAFAWYVDGPTVVVSLTVKVRDISQSQTMRFYPRTVSQAPAFVTLPC
jgi:prepilin-type N-terminal cleavage/methylation domain-containing protein